MATIPETEDRRGNPLEYTETASWTTLDENVYQCRVLLCPEEEGGFSAHAIRLPGVVSQGETVDSALANISEAFQGAVALYMEEGSGIPLVDGLLDRPQGSLEKWILVNV